MQKDQLLQEVTAKAQLWLSELYDAQTRAEVKKMLEDTDSSELIESFYRELEFGTGGLRGIMGAGTNRMNIYTVGAASQGICNYLKKQYAGLAQIKVAIGHDCRNNSRKFAQAAADIFAANGIKVYLFESLRPTPEISFAIRHLGCQSGCIVTASHNPKEYNGFKVYGNDGAQVIEPHDKNIIDEVSQVSVADIKFTGGESLIEIIGENIDRIFIDQVKKVALSPEVVARHKSMKIVYTPIHGTGIMLIPRALKECGFDNIINVPEQDVISGDFPTVQSPNPEEPAALKLAIDRAIATDADLVMASDPDADRVGAAVKTAKGSYQLLNGNQLLMLLAYYQMKRWKELGKLTGNEFVVSTIVSTEMIEVIAKSFDIEYHDCFTGFKWIAGVIRDFEGKKQYIGGGEESYGYLPGDFVRDKDAVATCVLLAELAAWSADQGKTLYELLQDIYVEFGFSKEKGISVVRKGKSGAEEIVAMMKNYRENPPKDLAGSPVVDIKDFSTLKGLCVESGKEYILDMPTTSDVLQYFAADGTKVSIRPSGTEPKIKFYIEVKDTLASRDAFDAVNTKADLKVEALKSSLGI